MAAIAAIAASARITGLRALRQNGGITELDFYVRADHRPSGLATAYPCDHSGNRPRGSPAFGPCDMLGANTNALRPRGSPAFGPCDPCPCAGCLAGRPRGSPAFGPSDLDLTPLHGVNVRADHRPSGLATWCLHINRRQRSSARITGLRALRLELAQLWIVIRPRGSPAFGPCDLRHPRL